MTFESKYKTFSFTKILPKISSAKKCRFVQGRWVTFLVHDWLSSFHTFADKQLIGFSLHLVGKLIMGGLTFGHAPLHTRPFLASDLWSSFWLLPTKHWSHLAQIWWANSIPASLVLINFWSCFTESQLWLPLTDFTPATADWGPFY